MNAGTDSYTLKMLDQITGPLNRVLETLNKVNDRMDDLNKAASGGGFLAGLAGGAVVAGIGQIGSAIGGLISLMRGGIGVVEGFIDKVLEAAKFRERYRTLLQHQLGETAGAQVYDKLLDVANLTPGTAAEMMQNASHLLNVGFRGRQFNAALGAQADVEAMYDPEAAGKFTRGISDMFSKAKLEEQDFKQALSGIVPVDVFERAILKLKGVHVAASKVNETFERMKKAGQFTGREGAMAALIAVNEHVDKGQGLGAYAVKRGAGSLEGLLSNLGEAWANLMRKMDFENMPGITALKGFLTRLLDFFSTATPEGQMLQGVLKDITNELFGGLGQISKDDLRRFFLEGVEAAKKLVAWLKEAWAWFGQLLHSGNFGDTLVQGLGDTVKKLGSLFGQGVADGFKAYAAAAMQPSSVMSSLPPNGHVRPDGLVDTTFYDAGPSSLRGLLSGKRAGGGHVDTGGAYLVGEEGPELFIPEEPGSILPHGSSGGAMAHGSSGGDTTINVERVEVIYAGETNEEKARDFASRLLEELRRMALRTGAPVVQ